jgi:hypothetical protein
MMELHNRLEQIAGPVPGPSAEQADADVARGRRALRRRRTVQRVGASAFAVAALAAAVAYGTAGGSTADHPTTPRVVAAHLVAYKGEQPEGFTIDKVPDGWEVQGVSAAVLTIAPKDAADKNMDSFVGKIAIMLQSQDDHSTPTGTKVTVGGRPGVINPGLGTDHGQNLWVKQPNGIWLQVQIWDASGWTQENIVEFGAGIHVQKGAVQGRG